MQNLLTWLGDLASQLKYLLLHTKYERSTSQLIAQITVEPVAWRLRDQLANLQAEKRAIRDSVVEHMAYEGKLREEISSLKRHLNMAIDERDQARKRKRPR